MILQKFFDYIFIFPAIDRAGGVGESYWLESSSMVQKFHLEPIQILDPFLFLVL